MAVFRIDKTRDYTVMSNYHLRDKRLSLKAKGLLSQMLSLPEDWDYTLTGLSYINRESKDAVRSAVNELEKYGYIERRQTTNERGKFSVNEYVIHESPVEPEAEQDAESPLSGNPTTAAPSLDYPSSENPTTGNPSTENPSPENPTQLNINKQITLKQKTDLSNTHSFLPSEAPAPAADGPTDGRDVREDIRDQIDYDLLVTPSNRPQVDELVEIMVEVAMNRGKTIKVGRDAEYPTSYVRERFEKLTKEHIEKVLDGISENTTRVYNTKAYLLAALFNVVSTIDNHYAMLVNHDLYGPEAKYQAGKYESL